MSKLNNICLLSFPVTKLEAKRQRFRQRITEYMDRAEKLKAHIDEEKESGPPF